MYNSPTACKEFLDAVRNSPRWTKEEAEPILNEVFALMAQGVSKAKSLKAVNDSKKYRRMSGDAFYRQVSACDKMAAAYANARDNLTHELMEQALDVASTERPYTIVTTITDNDGNVTTKEHTVDNVPRSTLELRAIEMYTARVNPERYGSKQTEQGTKHVEQPLFPSDEFDD